MAFTNNTRTNKTFANVNNAKIANVRQIGENVACFTLYLEGIALYNMRCIQRADGNFFIAPPQSKGKDGKWYNQYAVYLEEKDSQYLIRQILKELNVKE